jgi:predicted peroxiredoxin
MHLLDMLSGLCHDRVLVLRVDRCVAREPDVCAAQLLCHAYLLDVGYDPAAPALVTQSVSTLDHGLARVTTGWARHNVNPITPTRSFPMASILVHLTHGPEAPTRAALAFLVARTALEEGHEVSVFVAGDATQLLRPATLDATQGVGTGGLREHVDAVVEKGGKLYASGLSSKARGVDAEALGDLKVDMAPPNVLVRLLLDHDRTLTY